MWQRRPIGVAARLIWPIAAIVAMALSLVVATVIWTSEGANSISLEQQRSQVSAAIDDSVMMRARQFSALTVSPKPSDAVQSAEALTALEQQISDRSYRYFGFDGTLVFSHSGAFLSGLLNGEAVTEQKAGELAAFVQPALNALNKRIADKKNHADTPEGLTLADLRDLSTGLLMYDGTQTHLVVAAPITDSSYLDTDTWPLAVAFQVFNRNELAIMGARRGIEGLEFISRAPRLDEASIPITSVASENGAHLVWRPYRPGDLMRARLVPVSIFVLTAAVLFSGMIFTHVQRIALDLTRSEERARKMIGHDALSGLPNRLLFSQRLDQELARLTRVDDGLAVHFLDLDRFKDVNDTHGHQAGDELIKEVAHRLADLLRGADTLARFGGDEFAIIQTGVRNVNDAEALARRVLDDLTTPFAIAGTFVTVGCSIGVAMAPQNGRERETLMRLADTALYQAKNEGRNRYSFFERQMDEALKMRKLVEDDLRNAIDNNELLVHYQPQVSVDGETIVGVEALVRWPHAKRGMIPPMQFIPIAEERGLIIPLGDWVLRQACIDGKRWPGIRVAVNVSPIQFRNKDFVKTVRRILAETDFDPTCLEIELTEGVLVEDADAAEAALMELRSMGVHLALDDFGTGYSSLIYLRRFAFDRIKIDRSFLESMEATGESAILVHSIVHLGRALGLTVIAEGVETKEQHRFLQAVGCHELQGYLFSRPVPGAEIDIKLGLTGPVEHRKASAA
jgi:diguanylate cyclase